MGKYLYAEMGKSANTRYEKYGQKMVPFVHYSTLFRMGKGHNTHKGFLAGHRGAFLNMLGVTDSLTVSRGRHVHGLSGMTR